MREKIVRVRTIIGRYRYLTCTKFGEQGLLKIALAMLYYSYRRVRTSKQDFWQLFAAQNFQRSPTLARKIHSTNESFPDCSPFHKVAVDAFDWGNSKCASERSKAGAFELNTLRDD